MILSIIYNQILIFDVEYIPRRFKKRGVRKWNGVFIFEISHRQSFVNLDAKLGLI
jgi:hypothetical protein